MKLLFITRKYPPSIGGMERLSYHLITRMGQRVQVRSVIWGGSQKWLPLFLPYALIRSLVIGRGGIDLIHAGDPVVAPIGWIVGRFLRVPVVVTVHGLDITFPHPLYQWVVPRVLRHFDRVICISHNTLRVCVQRGIPASKCIVIHPGVSVPPSLPQREVARRWLERRIGRDLRGQHVLLTVGRLVPRKGVRWFVEAVLPQVTANRASVCYVVAGEGPEEQVIRALIEEKSLQEVVHLLGCVSDSDLLRLYTAADLFIMPNLSQSGDTEGFGLVALEAAAHALPVLAADLEGIRDAVVPGRTGYLVQSGNANLWVRQIQELLAFKPELRSLGQIARATVQERFTWSRMVDEYEMVFRRVVERQDK